MTICALPALAQDSEPPKPKVEVVAVENMVIAPTIEVPGTIVSRNDARIAAEVAGRIDWIADEGLLWRKATSSLDWTNAL